jgi:hypothetical protein
MSSSSSGSNHKPRKETSLKQVASKDGFLLFLFFDPEIEGDLFLRNVN